MTTGGPPGEDDRAPLQAPLTLARAGIVTGLAVEARLLEKAQKRLGATPGGGPPTVLCAGASSRRAAACAERLLHGGTGWLVSFGVAGGLDPALAPGTLLLPRTVRSERGRLVETDDARRGVLAGRARAAGLTVADGPLYGGSAPIGTATGKAALHRALGCVAVDMESHAVAAVAAKAGRPFLVVRAVADPADRPLPDFLDGAVNESGNSRLAPVLKQLARRPGSIGPLLRLRGDLRRALASLRKLLEVGGDVLLGGGL